MKDFKWLQLFAEGGEGGGEGSASAGAETGAQGGASAESSEMDAELARIPERARGAYKKALERNKAMKVETPKESTPKEESEKPKHLAYADLIKSDEYKEEHKAYMDKTIKDRFKKYEGLEENNAKMAQALNVVATKYGLDASSETFLDDLSSKINEDNSYYESYAEANDISVEEAKKNLELERKVKQFEMQEEQRRRQEAEAQAIATLRQNAEGTKQKFPDFNLELEMQNEEFRRLCAITHGDTTASYIALHHGEIIPKMVAQETERAKQAITNSIASGQARPIESGLSKQSAGVVNTTPSYKGMSAKEMKAYALANLTKK